MAIPGPGVAISMNTLNTEFGGGFALSSYYRGGSFVPNSPQNTAIPTSGTISLGNFYSSSNRVRVSITASGNNYDVYTNRGPSYVAGKTDLTVTVPGTIGSANTGSYAMLVPSAFSPTDTVTIINNGVIQGAGGAGGRGSGVGPFNAGAAGSVGGNAVYVNRPTTITNNGTLAGGGGGGGGAGARVVPGKPAPITYVGGGGGGGAGTVGGAGGVPTSGPAAGAAGTSGAGGAGGQNLPAGYIGGAGGGRGAAGAAGGPPGLAGGGAGNYLVGNAFVTFPATGTRQGGVS
jgi:hypothetical protein